MDLSEEKACEDLQSLAANIPVLSDYVKGLASHVKSRYLQKISVVGVDPASIPSDQFAPECLPPIESTDLLAYLVLETSHYTKDQFKAYKSLEAYHQDGVRICNFGARTNDFRKMCCCGQSSSLTTNE